MVIAIHDIPRLMTNARNHPHQDAIHVAGWVSLFTLHAIWPFLLIWATFCREDRWLSPGRMLAHIEVLEGTDAYQLPGRVVAEIAVYTHRWHHVTVLRKVLLLMGTLSEAPIVSPSAF